MSPASTDHTPAHPATPERIENSTLALTAFGPVSLARTSAADPTDASAHAPAPGAAPSTAASA